MRAELLRFFIGFFMIVGGAIGCAEVQKDEVVEVTLVPEVPETIPEHSGQDEFLAVASWVSPIEAATDEADALINHLNEFKILQSQGPFEIETERGKIRGQWQTIIGDPRYQSQITICQAGRPTFLLKWSEAGDMKIEKDFQHPLFSGESKETMASLEIVKNQLVKISTSSVGGGSQENQWHYAEIDISESVAELSQVSVFGNQKQMAYYHVGRVGSFNWEIQSSTPFCRKTPFNESEPIYCLQRHFINEKVFSSKPVQQMKSIAVASVEKTQAVEFDSTANCVSVQ